MNLGIVGHEKAKFTPETEAAARGIIRRLFREHRPSLVVSGGCHLGGIDIWAVEEAQAARIPFIEFLPEKRVWEGGYKQRNIQIAELSDLVVCIVVAKYPEAYDGIRFDHCYHCRSSNHIKSGGCWTMRYARKIGKKAKLEVVDV